jgi:RNA polymerase sigma-70 factor (ECF subfamily)
VEVVKTNGPPTVDDVSRLHAEDFYLACGCALGEPQALAAFDRSYLSQLPVLLGHMRLSNAVIGEVGQVLREKLLVGTGDRPARIRLYSGQGSLLGWLRVVATRAALNLGDAQDEKNVGDSGAVDALMTSQTPERALIMQQQRHDLLAILRDAIRTLPTEQRQALRMQMCDGLTGDDIAARLSVTRSTVVRWLSAAREATLKETERLFRQRLDLSGVEVEQVVAETRSHLDLRLSQLFRSAPDGEGVP